MNPPITSLEASIKPDSSSMGGLNPLGLLDGVLGGHAAEWSPPPARELETAFPGYTSFEYLDRGAMGAVYAATQISLQRRVAIKILPPEFSEDEGFITRFQQEALMLARLHHPHIVAVHDFGRSSQGGLYLVMEYVNGTSLQEILQQRRLKVAEVLDIVHQTCLALQFAHDHGVIHRDIKPSNILIDDRQRVRVADFGLAKLHRKDSNKPTTVKSGLGGTPVYAAPEQMRRNANVDHRCDIFSTAVTMYEMLTGTLPVGNFDPPSKKAATPALLDKIILKAMRENPDERHAKASELAEDIEAASRRLSMPVLNRAIMRRPIVSMMTTIIITAGLIFLFGEINEQILRSKPLASEPIEMPVEALVRLNAEFSLLNVRMNWEEAVEFASRHPGLALASLHSAAENAEVVRLLQEHDLLAPVWIGGRVRSNDGRIEWADGSPVDFEAWMPSASDPPLIITELQAKNNSTWKAPNGSFPDWIEVFNPGTQPVSLRGWVLRQNNSVGAFEDRLLIAADHPAAVIAPGTYRIITCGAPKDSSALNFEFPLDAQSSRIAWADPRGRFIQMFDRSWKEFAADLSLIADASGMQWAWSRSPTPGKPNIQTGRQIELNAQPRAPAAAAVILLPEFEGRWAIESENRRSVPLFRKTRP